MAYHKRHHKRRRPNNVNKNIHITKVGGSFTNKAKSTLMQSGITKCPNCGNANLKKRTESKGIIFKRHIVTHYCPACDFENKRIFRPFKK